MTDEKKTVTKKNNPLLIITISLLFLSPVVVSWLVFNYTDFIKIRGTSNKGELIIPPRPIADLNLIDPLNAERRDSLHGKWSLVYVAKVCDEPCLQNVYRIRQIHLAMDKHSLRVQKVLLLTAQEADEIASLLTDYAGQQVIDTALMDTDKLLKFYQLNDLDKPLEAGRLYIIDPLGNLMMYFHADANPRDIMNDLKKLLRASRIG